MVESEVSIPDSFVLNAIFNPHNPLEIRKKPCANTSDDADIDKELKQLEIDAVNAAQNGDLIKSLEMFDKLLHQVPHYSSGYNNRAQLFRIQGDNASAMNDLNKAIELSCQKGFVASQALVQRGLLFKLNGDDENASVDFRKAAQLGNKFAQQHLTAMNPYAALCNKMLSQVFSNELNPSVKI